MPRTPRCPACLLPSRRRLHTSKSPFRASPRSHTSTITSRTPLSRQFTHRSSLSLISQYTPRPQLPFLYPTSHGAKPAPPYRYLTTERKARWKATLRGQIRFHSYAWPIIGLCIVLYIGVEQIRYEYRHPTPREWSFWSRWNLRTGRHVELDEDAKVHRVLTNWWGAAQYYSALLRRLEDESMEGSNLIQGETLVDGVGRTGFDVNMKSEPWRRGYHQTLMGAGRVSEHLEGHAKRKGQESGTIIPWESVPGPSNPRPKPLPWTKSGLHLHPPTEEECEDAFPQPEAFYMKVLTTRGFDSGQRLDAALAYADWCDFKGLSDTAGSMYDWALDIAMAGLPEGSNGVADIQTGVIQQGKESLVTTNILKATTAMAIHNARAGKAKEALPIFLSVLRARKQLPAAPAYFEAKKKSIEPKNPGADLFAALKAFVLDQLYPPAPPTGDERPFHTLKEACEEIGLMTYIGEILFATSSSEKEKGLSWTRDSVEASEAVMWVMDETDEQDGREKCRQCLDTGLKNWQTMAQEMRRLSLEKQQQAQQSSGLLGTGWGQQSAVEKAQKEAERWKLEEEQIELRKEKTFTLIHPLKPVKRGWMTV